MSIATIFEKSLSNFQFPGNFLKKLETKSNMAKNTIWRNSFYLKVEFDIIFFQI